MAVSELPSLAARLLCAYWNQYTSAQLDALSCDTKLLKQLIEDVATIKQGCGARKVAAEARFDADAAGVRVAADAAEVLRRFAPLVREREAVPRGAGLAGRGRTAARDGAEDRRHESGRSGNGEFCLQIVSRAGAEGESGSGVQRTRAGDSKQAALAALLCLSPLGISYESLEKMRDEANSLPFQPSQTLPPNLFPVSPPR